MPPVQPKKQPGKSDKELEETLKKLRAISK
jgi:hypothetical protein